MGFFFFCLGLSLISRRAPGTVLTLVGFQTRCFHFLRPRVGQGDSAAPVGFSQGLSPLGPRHGVTSRRAASHALRSGSPAERCRPEAMYCRFISGSLMFYRKRRLLLLLSNQLVACCSLAGLGGAAAPCQGQWARGWAPAQTGHHSARARPAAVSKRFGCFLARKRIRDPQKWDVCRDFFCRSGGLSRAQVSDLGAGTSRVSLSRPGG